MIARWVFYESTYMHITLAPIMKQDPSPWLFNVPFLSSVNYGKGRRREKGFGEVTRLTVNQVTSDSPWILIGPFSVGCKNVPLLEWFRVQCVRLLTENGPCMR